MLRDLQVTPVPVAALVPYAENARTHSDAQVAQIADSIAEFGFVNPVLVDAAGVLVAGHGRVMAAKRLGMAAVPAIRLLHLTEAQARALRLADNQIALNSGWDEALLAAELARVREDGFDLAQLGFDQAALDALLAETGLGGSRNDADEDAPAPEPPAMPISRRGDTWLLGAHRLRCGDSTNETDVTGLLAGAKPHLMVTDPPYGVEYDPIWRKRRGLHSKSSAAAYGIILNDNKSDWREAWAIFPGEVVYVWHPGAKARPIIESLEATQFDIRAQIIWVKERIAVGRGNYHYQHEPCYYAVRKGGTAHWCGGRKQSTVWEVSRPVKLDTGHSTQKPVFCMQKPMENNSKRGDAVYDPFCGSGTTIIAGEVTGRRVLAMELNPAYVDVAVRRWREFTGGIARLDTSDGPTFTDVANARRV
jgi:DNA modification methylase